jgi:5-methylcytosine-specific restriction endonuclease McrBC regulatory subunit McrC
MIKSLNFDVEKVFENFISTKCAKRKSMKWIKKTWNILAKLFGAKASEKNVTFMLYKI